MRPFIREGREIIRIHAGHVYRPADLIFYTNPQSSRVWFYTFESRENYCIERKNLSDVEIITEFIILWANDVMYF